MSRSLAIVLTAGTAAALGLAPSAAGQTIDWLVPAGGSWDNAASWAAGNIPDAAGENARFSAGGVYTVTLPTSKTIGDLLALDAIALSVNNGVALASANATNNGVVTINAQGGGSTTSFIIGNGGTLSGSGRITLNATSGVLARAMLYSGPANSWTHSAGHTIDGRGQVYYGFSNQGLVTANVPNQTLQMLQGVILNAGVLRAQDGGVLNLTTETVTQQPGASVLATGAGSAVTLSGVTITGGSLSASGGGLLTSASGTQRLTGLTLSGPLNINDNSDVILDGVVTNQGTTLINAQGGGSVTSLQVTAGATLGGSGRVTLNATSGVLDRAQLYSPTQQTWTHGAGHTIGGAGNIYYDLENRGTITADAAGAVLQLRNGTVTNLSTITTAGGTLSLLSETVAQNGGVLAATDGAVLLQGATIQGGAMTSSGASHFVSTSGTQVLTGVSLQGTLDINNGTNISCPTGLAHQGLILINTQGGGSVTTLQIGTGSTLGGTGTVTLNATSGVLDRAQLYNPATLAWTHAAGHTVNGRGNVYYDITNAGVFAANMPAEVLQLRNGVLGNTGQLRADAGAILALTAESITQSGAGTIAAAGGEVRLSGVTVSGGTLSSGPGQRILSVSGTQSLSNLTTSAVFDIADNTQVAVPGTITDNGQITVNVQGGGSATSLTVSSGQSILGTGTIALNATSGVLDRSYIQSSGGPWTHGPQHTIRGRGRVYGDWSNLGLLTADAPAETLEVLNGTTTNSGTLRAAGGFLSITAATINQNPGGSIQSAGGGAVRLSGATISGGAMSGPSSFVTTSGTTTLTGGVTLASPLDVNNNTTLSLPSGLTNHGAITVNAQGGGSATPIRTGPDVTLAGSGSITLNATSGVLDRSYLHTPAGALTIGHGQTIAGTGRIYATWTNHGDLHPSGPSRLLDLQQGPYTQAPDGSLTIDLFSPAVNGRLTGPTLKTLGGTLRVTLQNGYIPNPCDGFTIITGPVAGRFDALDLPTVPFGRLGVLYNANSVELRYIPADFNGDGFPDFFDYDEFVQCFETGVCPEGATADFNNDGFIDFFDYDAFVEAFERGC